MSRTATQPPDGFAEFVTARSHALLRAAWLLTGDAGRAEDLLQVALARSWRHWGRIAESNAEGYVRRVLFTAYLSGWRRQWRAEVPSAAPPERASTEDVAAATASRDGLRRALAGLTRRQRAVVILRYVELGALEAVRFTRVSTTVISVIQSPEAAAAGCGQFAGDMVAAMTQINMSAPPGPGVNPFDATSSIRRCVYRVPAAERRTPKPTGTFEHGGTLGPDQLTLIGQALAATGPARACTTLGGRFAVLSLAAGRNQLVYVELDGCLRILFHPEGRGLGVLAQGDAALANLLDQR